MSGCLAENTLVEFVEGRLDAAATASLHRHVDDCPACRALLREVGGAFFTEPVAAPSQGSAEHRSLSLPIAEPSAASSRISLREGVPRRPRKVSLRPGESVGKYRVRRQIGVGGMGVVFEAVHEQLRRRVAVKVLYPHYSENPQMVARLLNEARAANIVRHPAIVSSFEVGHLPSGEAFLVMEYLDGEPLRLRMQRRGGRLGPGGLRILRQVASALGAAHGWGVIHRDLKPANVMLVPDPEMAGGERVKILDFGLAKVGAELREEGEEFSTHAGVILGTPAYMAPEQCQEAATVDEKADVYSLGVMLFEWESGRLPFAAKGAVDLMAMHIYVPAPSLREAAPSAPEALVRLVARTLSKTPSERPTMAEVAAELERLEGLGEGDRALAPVTAPVLAPPPRGRPALWVALAAAAAVAAGLGLWRARPVPAPAPIAISSPPSPSPSSPSLSSSSSSSGDPLPPAAVASASPLPGPRPSALPERPASAPPRSRAAPRPEPSRPARRASPPPAPAPGEDWTDDKIRIFQ